MVRAPFGEAMNARPEGDVVISAPASSGTLPTISWNVSLPGILTYASEETASATEACRRSGVIMGVRARSSATATKTKPITAMRTITARPVNPNGALPTLPSVGGVPVTVVSILFICKIL